MTLHDEFLSTIVSSHELFSEIFETAYVSLRFVFDAMSVGVGNVYHFCKSRTSYPPISIGEHPVFLISIYSPSVSSPRGFGRSEEKTGDAHVLSGIEKMRRRIVIRFINVDYTLA